MQNVAVHLVIVDDKHPQALERFARLAESDSSAVVRLYLASALQRLDLDRRWPIAKSLVGHAEDREDHNLPLMLWFGIEPLVAADPRRALRRRSN